MDGSLPSYLEYLINFGVLGLVVIALLTGWLYTKGYVNELKANHRKEIKQLKDDHEEEITEWKHALTLERQRADVGVVSGKILNDLASVLRKELKP